MSAQVVTVANRIPDRNREPYYHYDSWLASLRKFGVEPTVLGMGEQWNGLMTKPRRLRQWLRDGQCQADVLIATDCFDVLFAAHPDEVAERYRSATDSILFNAEKGLFPRGDLAHHFPDTGTPWRYLNSGVIIGPPAQILAMLEGMKLDDLNDDRDACGNTVNVNDQAWYQVGYCLQIVPQVLDSCCEVTQTFSAYEENEFDFTGSHVLNLVTMTKPLVWHCNGGAKDVLMPRLIGMLNL